SLGFQAVEYQPWRFASCAAPFGHYREQQEAHPDGKRGCMPGRRLAGGEKAACGLLVVKTKSFPKKDLDYSPS
ncbi:MAG: hypothetical protein QM270_01265, partial [Bacillota bacterium]|nr:hypothetical protein [Bacillota bacterium]